MSLGKAGVRPARVANVPRTIIPAAEHETKILPAAMFDQDGRIDIYAEVRRLVQLTFKDGAPAVQCGRHVGLIPLNDKYALEIQPRVMIRNLERIVARVAGYTPKILSQHLRRFAPASEQPSSFISLISDSLLDVLDEVFSVGLLAGYHRQSRVGQFPYGRIDPFKSGWRSMIAGRPQAQFSAFDRTVNIAPNRILVTAVGRLRALYSDTLATSMPAMRLLRINNALRRLSAVSAAFPAELSSILISQIIRTLPVSHLCYVDALTLAGLIVSDQTISIRDQRGDVVLPTVLIDMESVFETYARKVLEAGAAEWKFSILNGNTAPPGGGKTTLFEDMGPGMRNAECTPDILISDSTNVRMILDAKYKPSRSIPERPDLNQVLGYGLRYRCNKVAILYPERSADQQSVRYVGRIGPISIYVLQIDLNAEDIEAEEEAFVREIKRAIDVVRAVGAKE